MTSRKRTSRRAVSERRAGRASAERGRRSRGREQRLDFGGSPVIVGLPPSCGGETIHGTMVGTWTTRLVSRGDFAVVAVAATLRLRPTSIRVEGVEDPVELGDIPLTLGAFPVPAPLRKMFPGLNTGTFDAASRLYRVTIGFHAQLPVGSNPSRIVFTSFGTILEGGALLSGGLGVIVGGPGDRTIIACGCGAGRSTASAPAAAPALCVPGISAPNDTWLNGTLNWSTSGTSSLGHIGVSVTPTVTMAQTASIFGTAKAGAPPGHVPVPGLTATAGTTATVTGTVNIVKIVIGTPITISWTATCPICGASASGSTVTTVD